MSKPLRGRELVEEYIWLVDNGMSPMLAIVQLKAKADNMARLLYRHGFAELGAELARDKNWPGRVHRD